MRARLIGITGKAGSGKDTLADAAVTEFGGVKYSFALPIKQALNAMFGWTMNMWDNRDWKEAPITWLGVSPRKLAQTLGTEWGRDIINPDLWVRIAMDRYWKHVESGSTKPFIIADVRFDNEAISIHKFDGIIINVVRPSQTFIQGATHVSEAGVSDALVDHVLYNDTSMERYLARNLPFMQQFI